MKAIVLTGVRQMDIRDIPEPAVKNDSDVLLKIELVGICGSDVHYYNTGRIGSQIVQYPFIIGHECTAAVKAVGRAVKKIKVGNKVVVDPAVSCHNCDQCKIGRENTCRNLRFLGTPGQGNGCLCEYIVMPQQCCFPIDGSITLEQGALCEPFAIGVYSVKQAQMSESAAVAVLGSGPIGLSCMAASQAQNARAIYITDKLDYRLNAAKKTGAAWVGNPDKQNIVKEILEREPLGIDVVYECAGQQSTIDEAVDLLKPGGKLILVGIPEFERISFIIDRIRRKEITIVNIRRQNGCTKKAIDLIAAHKVNIDFMITHKFRFQDAQKAFELVAGYNDGVIKALIEF